MFCRNCGTELRSQSTICPVCGAPIDKKQTDSENAQPNEPLYNNAPDAGSYGYAETRYQQPYNEQPYDAPPYDAQPYNAPQRKKPLGVLPIVLIALSALIVVGTVAFVIIYLSMNNNDDKSLNEEYAEILTGAKDDIDNYVEDTDSDPVAFFDIDRNGKDDMLYVDRPHDRERPPRLNYVLEDEGSARPLTAEEVNYFVLFYRPQDDKLYLYDKKGNSERFYLLSSEDMSKIGWYGRTYDEDADKYEYSVHLDDADSDTPKEDYESFTSSLQEEEVVVLLTTMDEEELDDLFDKSEVVSVGYDDAVDYLDQNDDDDDETKTDETKKTGETVDPTVGKMEDVAADKVPKEVTTFLQGFDFAYVTVKDGKNSREYNCEKADSALVGKIAGNPTCVDMTLYPGEKTEQGTKVKSDPKGKYKDTGYISFEENKVLWVMENIFNIPKDKCSKLISEAVSGKSDLYEYEKNGKKYLCNSLYGVGGPGYTIKYQKARTDGEKYYLVYQLTFEGSKDAEAETCYAEMAKKEIDGKSYWTIYRHTKDIPDWGKEKTKETQAALSSPKPTEKPKSEEPEVSVFEEFAGSYTFTSGVGAWATVMTIESDGSFSGNYHDSNMGETGPDYPGGTLYYSDFTGTFTNPKKVNDYTYSFELSEINYENEPDTEEIKDVYDSGTNQLVKYWTAYGLDNGTKTVYAYTADAPWDELPENFQSWIKMAGYNESSGKLGRKCLYTVETEYGWYGDKE